MKQKKIWSQELYLKALRFAGEAHGDQKIPGTELPYVIHLTSVCMEVMTAVSLNETEDPDLAIQCALLHDTIEDAGVTFEQIQNIFGKNVAEGVLALTKDEKLEKKLKMADSIERIKLQPREVRMVKLADRITNLQPPPAHWSAEKISRYRLEADSILEHLGEADPFLERRLREKIENYP